MSINREEFLQRIKSLASRISSSTISGDDLLSYQKYFEAKYDFHEEEDATYLLVYLTLKHSENVIAYIEYLFTINEISLNSYNVVSGQRS